MNINFLINKYKYESKFLKFQSIRISLASPKTIKKWSLSQKSNFEKFSQSKILNPKTFNYKTLKPEKGGLFCETIFGSLKNLSSRRYKLGYIELIFPVTHIWYLKGSISYISIILNLKKKNLESVAYCLQFLSTQIKSFKHNLNYINFSSILKSNLINNNSILNSSIFKSNYNFISSFDYQLCYLIPNLKKKNIKELTFINHYNNKNYFNLKKKYNKFLKFNRLNKIKNIMVGLNKNWIDHIKLKNEPIVILRLSNPINLIFHSILKNNFKFNNLNLLLKNKFKNIILKKNSYSIDFPILLFMNNKILKKLILHKKKNNFFITHSNLFKINNNNFLNLKSNIINDKFKNINLIYNTKTNKKTYFNNINIFIDFYKFQELPFQIYQSGYYFFDINKKNLIINDKNINYLFFDFNENQKINNLCFSEINFKFKNYKNSLETFIWLFYLNNKKEKFNNINSKKLINYSNNKLKNNFYFSNSKKKEKEMYKSNLNNKTQIKYISNILFEFYKKYSQFEKNNFIQNNNIFKIKLIKKFNIKKFYIKLIKIKNKIRYYNINTINNLILLEKYYYQDEYTISNIYKNKNTTNLKIKYKSTKFKIDYSNRLLNIINLKLLLKKYNNKLVYLKKINNINKKIFNVNEYCFSLIRFQNILKNLHFNLKLKLLIKSNFLINEKLKIKNNLVQEKKYDFLFNNDINNIKINKKNILPSFLLLEFENNLKDEKINILDLKLKNKLKNQLINQFYLYKNKNNLLSTNFNKKSRNKINFKIYFIPRFFKINKKLFNFNNVNIYFNYMNLYSNVNNNNINIKPFLKNPLGNNKFRKFITSILLTTIQKSLIICKIKLFKKSLIEQFYKLEYNSNLVNFNEKNNLKIQIFKLLLNNEKKQLVTFFFNNYGQLTELIGFSPNLIFNSSNYDFFNFYIYNDKNSNENSKLIQKNKENNFLKNINFFDLYDFDLEKQNIINYQIKYPKWLNKLNNSLNFFFLSLVR